MRGSRNLVEVEIPYGTSITVEIPYDTTVDIDMSDVIDEYGTEEFISNFISNDDVASYVIEKLDDGRLWSIFRARAMGSDMVSLLENDDFDRNALIHAVLNSPTCRPILIERLRPHAVAAAMNMIQPLITSFLQKMLGLVTSGSDQLENEDSNNE